MTDTEFLLAVKRYVLEIDPKAEVFVKTDMLSVEWSRFYTQLFNDRNNSNYEDFAIYTEDEVLP